MASSSTANSVDDFRLVVTGSGRSGTGFTAALLTHSGISCGHEEIFGPWVKDSISARRLRNDASWLAAPYLSSLPPSTLVVHQTRHPLAVARSYLGIAFFAEASVRASKADTHGVTARKTKATLSSRGARLLRDGGILGSRHATRADFLRFLSRHASTVFDATSEAERFSRYWLHWNISIDKAAKKAGLPYLRCRVEDWNPDLVVHVAQEAGAGDLVSRQSVEVALHRTPRDINSRTRLPRLQWSDLEPGRTSADVRELAHIYGYE